VSRYAPEAADLHVDDGGMSTVEYSTVGDYAIVTGE
jgi:hypothetical protein